MRRMSIETIRLALKRLGVGWQRAKHWITSPDPANDFYVALMGARAFQDWKARLRPRKESLSRVQQLQPLKNFSWLTPRQAVTMFTRRSGT
jgi:hypothetical protein